MKKKTKQTIIVLFIIIIFGMSSLAFVAINVTTPQEQPNQNLLTDFVIDGDINQNTEFQYIRNGYTFLRFYYTENDPFITYIEQIPEAYVTNLNQKQVFVLKIPANETYIKLNNLYGEKEIHNLTYEKIFETLCESLVVTPSECGLRSILINETNAT